jgi:predicted metal-binding membrane protein
MTTKTAKNIQAVLINAECPCGGSVTDAVTGSYDFTGGDDLICDTCESPIVIKAKTARR